MSIATVIFVGSSLALLHTYVLYPLTLWLMRKSLGSPLTVSGITSETSGDVSEKWPAVSVIIPFHNESKWVARKLENTFSCDYPENRLEVIAVSDGSEDTTNDILNTYKGRARIISYHPRQGKATALNAGAAQARGAILIFTDANVLIEPKAIRAMVARYEEQTVGAVSSKIALQSEGTGEPLGEGLYMRYEQWLYSLESQIQTMIVGDGAFLSVRRELFKALSPDTVTDDFSIALHVIGTGKRLVYEPQANGIEVVIPNVSAEFCRKVRMIAGGYQAVGRCRNLLNPVRFPLVSFQLISHKLLRWWAPFFLTAAFVSAAVIASDDVLFAVIFTVLCLFYALAGLGWLSAGLRQWRIVYLPYYFVVTNLAAVQGLWRFLQGQQASMWEKVAR
jgi:cellulose synthase/poly-beta-1,6-N-acetylglucosamine synthase-like glycosyltransferase